MAIPQIQLTEPDDDVARAIERACTEVGFFAITGHGVPNDTIRHAWEATEQFFDLPFEEKMQARHLTDPNHPYGYFPPGQEALAASLGIATPPDLKESFNLAPPPHHADGTGRFGECERIWPSNPRHLRRAWTAYYDAMVELAGRLLELMARALDTDPALFAAATDQHLSALRGLNYPSLTHPPAPGQLRAGEHSDYGTLTILLPGPGTGGLEVLRADGEWVAVQPIDGGFVVNLGDMMAHWTNDRWRSTRHRVAIPDTDAATIEQRLALAFFHQPNWDVEINAIASCRSAGVRPDDPVLAGPWLAKKFDAASTGNT